jgi:glycosyltransferase involved in cell wall biosynthesis
MDDKKNFSFFYRVVRRLLFQVSVSRSKMFHTISEYSKQRINLWFGRDALGVVTPCGTDLVSIDVEKRIASLDRDGNLPGPLKVLYISRLESRKNHRLLCESLSSFDVGTFSLNCVIGNDSQDHSGLISELASLFPDITIHKNISPDDLRCLIDSSHLAVYPSSGEGFGIPVVETLAAGLPTLVNRNTALAELKIPSRFLISVQTASDLSRELARFLSGEIDAPRAEEIDEILAEYSWDTCANRFFSEVFGFECSD